MFFHQVQKLLHNDDVILLLLFHLCEKKKLNFLFHSSSPYPLNQSHIHQRAQHPPPHTTTPLFTTTHHYPPPHTTTHHHTPHSTTTTTHLGSPPQLMYQKVLLGRFRDDSIWTQLLHQSIRPAHHCTHPQHQLFTQSSQLIRTHSLCWWWWWKVG